MMAPPMEVFCIDGIESFVDGTALFESGKHRFPALPGHRSVQTCWWHCSRPKWKVSLLCVIGAVDVEKHEAMSRLGRLPRMQRNAIVFYKRVKEFVCGIVNCKL